MEISGRVNHLRNSFTSENFYVQKLLVENAGMNESTLLPRVHARTLPVVLPQRFGTGVEMRRTFDHRLAACVLKLPICRAKIA